MKSRAILVPFGYPDYPKEVTCPPRIGPVAISDSSDSTNSGAPGDSTYLLRRC